MSVCRDQGDQPADPDPRVMNKDSFRQLPVSLLQCLGIGDIFFNVLLWMFWHQRRQNMLNFSFTVNTEEVVRCRKARASSRGHWLRAVKTSASCWTFLQNANQWDEGSRWKLSSLALGWDEKFFPNFSVIVMLEIIMKTSSQLPWTGPHHRPIRGLSPHMWPMRGRWKGCNLIPWWGMTACSKLFNEDLIIQYERTNIRVHFRLIVSRIHSIRKFRLISLICPPLALLSLSSHSQLFSSLLESHHSSAVKIKLTKPTKNVLCGRGLMKVFINEFNQKARH